MGLTGCSFILALFNKEFQRFDVFGYVFQVTLQDPLCQLPVMAHSFHEILPVEHGLCTGESLLGLRLCIFFAWFVFHAFFFQPPGQNTGQFARIDRLGYIIVHEHQVVGNVFQCVNGFLAIGHGIGAQAHFFEDAQGTETLIPPRISPTEYP